MNWFAWAFVGWAALCSWATIMCIGKDRTPITPGFASINILIWGLMTWGVCYYCGGRVGHG